MREFLRIEGDLLSPNLVSKDAVHGESLHRELLTIGGEQWDSVNSPSFTRLVG